MRSAVRDQPSRNQLPRDQSARRGRRRGVGVLKVLNLNLHDNDYDIIANPPAMSDGESHSFGYGIMKDFYVSIPSCTGELGR